LAIDKNLKPYKLLPFTAEAESILRWH